MTKKKKVLAIVVGLVMVAGLAFVPYTGMVKEAQASTTYKVTITVLQHDGSNTPVPNAWVRIKKGGSWVGSKGKTGSDGIAEFGGNDYIWLADATYKCYAYKGPGSSPNLLNAAVNTFTVNGANVALTQYLTEFEVKVLQHDGSDTPVQNAWVNIKKGNSNVATGKTGSDGIAEFGPSTSRADNIWLGDATYKCRAYKGPGSSPNHLNAAVNTFTVGATAVTTQTQYLTKFTVEVKNTGLKVIGAKVRLQKSNAWCPYLRSVGSGKYETWVGDAGYKIQVSSGVIRFMSPKYNVPSTTFVSCNLGATWK